MPATKPTVDLALQGGGAKGLALNAAMAELHRRGYVIRRVVGTSAGAIASALVAAGFTGQELVRMTLERTADDLPTISEYVSEPLVSLAPDAESELSEVQVAALRLPGELGRRLLSAHAALGFLERGGFISGEGFVGWLVRVLEGKRPGLSRATLGELHAATGAHLTIIVTDSTSRRLRALNHLSAPGCPLVMAVRMSMSIPLVFTEVVWRSEWGPYLGEQLTGHVMVDGGLISNLPVGFILPSANALVSQLMGPVPPGPASPIAFVLDTSLEVPGAPPAASTSLLAARLGATRVGKRVSALADSMLRGVDLTLTDSNPELVCRLPAKDYGTTEFDMSLARVEALLAAATAATATYLDALEARTPPSSVQAG